MKLPVRGVVGKKLNQLPHEDTLNGQNSTGTEDLTYFVGAAELLSVEILKLISHFSPKASISVHSWRLFCIATCPLRARFLHGPLSGDRRLSVSQRLKCIISTVKSTGSTLTVRRMEAVRMLESSLWEVPL